ncbi:hypothetical protein H6F74_28315 [Trichocoleus sp. FACHB-90]|uniref:hypothetical protein n=1 Tax=Cyanophyceae TaxID=3028117 RepID=UPI0016857C42|nr:hypothetical protein [Trichocoleus sp. FACHB-90]MBD1930096.1 hypothetical protein [Trichocoleus sp. FACHB-90]
MSEERKKLNVGERLLALVFWIFFACCGAAFMEHSTDAAEKLRHFEQLQLVTATGFKNSVPGKLVAIEGHVSKHTPTQFNQFVAYIRQQYEGTDDMEVLWSEDLRVTPPLVLALPDALIQIKNNSYNIERFPITWQEDSKLIRNSVTNEGTKRYLGFEVDSPVLAFGVVVQGVEGKALEAEWIYGGTSAEYIDGIRHEERFRFWMGLSMLIGGVIIAVKVLANPIQRDDSSANIN